MALHRKVSVLDFFEKEIVYTRINQQDQTQFTEL